MKSYFFLVAALACFAACQNHDASKRDLSALAKDSARFTSIKWLDSVKNIGTVSPGKKVAIAFRFKNTGDKPLFVISAEPGCGCTIADYPKQPILPGAEGLISAAYDVHTGTEGDFRKNIHVTTNTIGATSHYIFFFGTIKNKKDSTATTKVDTVALSVIKAKELKRNLLLQSTKN